MHQEHDMVRTLDLSKSDMEIADFGLQMKVCQSLIISLPYGVAKIHTYSVKKFETSLERDEYINYISR